MNGLGYPVYYINMDKSGHRKKYMESQFEKYQIDYIRIKAIDGTLIKNINGDEIDGITFQNTYLSTGNPSLYE